METAMKRPIRRLNLIPTKRTRLLGPSCNLAGRRRLRDARI
jgi:hypothetical protein